MAAILATRLRQAQAERRLLHHAHVLECGPRSWRTKVQTDVRTEEVSRCAPLDVPVCLE
jgi:hypothetical protein